MLSVQGSFKSITSFQNYEIIQMSMHAGLVNNTLTMDPTAGADGCLIVFEGFTPSFSLDFRRDSSTGIVLPGLWAKCSRNCCSE